MIRKLRGLVEEMDAEGVIINVAGVGYYVLCSLRQRTALRAGEIATLWIETLFRDDRILLLGFPNEEDLKCFRLLTHVQGVGPKLALAILGELPAADLPNIIAREESHLLSSTPGVGARLASRIVNELKEKILEMPSSDISPASDGEEASPPLMPQAVSALVNLGYAEHAAKHAVMQLLHKRGGETPLQDLIRDSLKALAS